MTENEAIELIENDLKLHSKDLSSKYKNGLRTAINEPILKKSERMSLRIILNRLRIKRNFTLMPSDIEIHINHNKIDNLLTKSEALKMLLEAGVDYKRAIKTVDLFSDSEAVALESKARMEYLYPTSAEKLQQNNNPINKEVVE